jgi:uncharacterized protein YjbI with pentapeptide repeats
VHRITPVAAPRLPASPADRIPPPEDHAEWRELALTGSDLSGLRMRALEVTDVAFDKCNLANLTAVKAMMTRSAFTGCRMTGFAFPDGAIDDARFSDCLIDLGTFGFTRFRRTIFSGCILRDADFTESSFDSVRFHRCELEGASFAGARFVRSEMRGCALEGIQGVEGLRGVALDWSDIVGLAGTMAAHLGIEVVEEEQER